MYRRLASKSPSHFGEEWRGQVVENLTRARSQKIVGMRQRAPKNRSARTIVVVRFSSAINASPRGCGGAGAEALGYFPAQK